MTVADRAIATLPVMGCGTWAWGNRLLWDYDPSMDEQLQAVFAACVAGGVTLFDTGDSYGTGKLSGRSEILLGRFARDYRGPHGDRLCLATKLAPYPWRLNRGAMLAAGEASAQRLGRSIDLVQLHWSTANYAPWQEGILLDGLADLVDRGLAKTVGLSNFGPQRLRLAHQRLADRGVAIATLQVQYSLLSVPPGIMAELRSLCQTLNIRLIAYSPLALGVLTGKFDPAGPFPGGLRGWVLRQLVPKAQPVVEQLRQIAIAHGKTPAQVALNWCIAQGAIPIPGAKTLAQAQENLGAIGWSLTPAELDQLNTATTASGSVMVQNIFQSR